MHFLIKMYRHLHKKVRICNIVKYIGNRYASCGPVGTLYGIRKQINIYEYCGLEWLDIVFIFTLYQ